jgi:hypothetical protein
VTLPGGKILLVGKSSAGDFLEAIADTLTGNARQAIEDALETYNTTGELDWDAVIATLTEGLSSSDVLQLDSFQNLVGSVYVAESDDAGIVTFDDSSSIFMSEPRGILLDALGISDDFTASEELNTAGRPAQHALRQLHDAQRRHLLPPGV